jgi:hypothetical protein
MDSDQRAMRHMKFPERGTLRVTGVHDGHSHSEIKGGNRRVPPVLAQAEREYTGSGPLADPGNGAPVLQVDQARTAGCRPYPAPDRPPE